MDNTLNMYLNDGNLEITKLNLYTFACEIATRAKIYEHIGELEIFLNNEDRNPRDLDHLIQTVAMENIIDSIRFCMFFENVAKGQLLSKKILIHKIKPEWSNELQKEQKKRPIYRDELQDESNGYYATDVELFHPGLGKQTIGLDIIISNKTYLNELTIPTGIISYIKEIKDKRNELHLNTQAGFELSNSVLKSLKEIKTYTFFIK